MDGASGPTSPAPWIHALIRKTPRGAVLFGTVHLYFLRPVPFMEPGTPSRARALSLSRGRAPPPIQPSPTRAPPREPKQETETMSERPSPRSAFAETGRGRCAHPVLIRAGTAPANTMPATSPPMQIRSNSSSMSLAMAVSPRSGSAEYHNVGAGTWLRKGNLPARRMPTIPPPPGPRTAGGVFARKSALGDRGDGPSSAT